MRGLIMYVARTAGYDCTNGGISSRFDRVTLVGAVEGDRVRFLPSGARIFEPADDAPPVLLEVRRIGQPVLSIVPAEIHDGLPFKRPGWWMAGGNYASASDSRIWDFAQDITDGERFYGAVAIHDRKEG